MQFCRLTVRYKLHACEGVYVLKFKTEFSFLVPMFPSTLFVPNFKRWSWLIIGKGRVCVRAKWSITSAVSVVWGDKDYFYFYSSTHLLYLCIFCRLITIGHELSGSFKLTCSDFLCIISLIYWSVCPFFLYYFFPPCVCVCVFSKSTY